MHLSKELCNASSFLYIGPQVPIKYINGTKHQYDRNAGVIDITLSLPVIGCTEPNLPAQYRVRHNGDTATVTCEHNGESWTLSCRGDTWTGDVGNCSLANVAGVFGQTAMGTNYLSHGEFYSYYCLCVFFT